MRIIIRLSRPFWRGIWDRRRVVRHSIRDWPADRGANLQWESPGGEKLLASVEYRDWSLRGLQLEAPSAVPAHAQVQLDGQQIGCLGSVRYCKQIGERYRVGIKVIRWFTPETS